VKIISLDKWIKTEKKKKKQVKNNEIVKVTDDASKEKKDKKDESIEISDKFEKFELICKNVKCKYKKILKKKRISEKDLICPRCKNEMKVKKI
jgi:hypothetical protein